MAVVRHPAIGGPDRPVVSVCIANYNGEQLLADCIDSVLAQEGAPAIEIIVHDDGSSDASIRLLRERYRQVELLASDHNVGFCIANNRMVDMASGEFVLLLNNDAALFPDAIATLLAHARGQQPEGILTLPQYDWETGALVDRGCLLDPFYTPVPNTDPRRCNVAYVIGACLFTSRQLWRELDGFPEWMESIGEDLYLCSIARLRGIPVNALDASGYRHRQGASFGGNRPGERGLETQYRRRYLSERNRLTVHLVCTPTCAVWPWAFILVLGMLVEGFVLSATRLSCRPFAVIYIPAIRDATRHFRRTLAARKVMQHARRTSLRFYLDAFTLHPRKLYLLFKHGFPRISGHHGAS